MLALAAVLGTPHAMAQGEAPPIDAVDEAREAFVRGTALAHQGQWSDALAEFTRSASLRSHPVTTYNIGFCERASGHYTRARDRFAAALAAHDARDGGELPDDLLRSARTYRDEADARLVRLTVTLEPAEAALSVDGRPLAVASNEGEGVVLVAGTRDLGRPEQPPVSRFVMLVDPGHHLFVVARPGVADVVLERSFDEGATHALTLTAHAPPAPAPAPFVRPVPIADEGEPLLGGTPGYVVLGAGAVLLTAGGILGLIYAANRADLDDVCIEGECPSDRAGQIDATNAVATTSWVTTGVGVGALATGIVLLVVRGPAKADGAGVAIDPVIGFANAGVQISF